MKFKGTIEATTEEKLNVLHSALCNGLYYFAGYGIELDWDASEYAAVRDDLNARAAAGTWTCSFGTATVCIEDIWTEMVRTGKNLVIRDLEAEDEDDNIIGTINLSTLESNWNKIPLRHLTAMVEEQDDANTADVILQSIAFGEEVYG